jgi:stage II sporulation protein D
MKQRLWQNLKVFIIKNIVDAFLAKGKEIAILFFILILSINSYAINIKIGVEDNLSHFKFLSNSGFHCYSDDKKLDVTFRSSSLLVKVIYGKFYLNGYCTSKDKVYISSRGKNRVIVGGNTYRGKIFINQYSKNRFCVINYVNLEDYLKGVVGCEMMKNFEPAALKAQAVIARTYALKYLGKHASHGFDLCNKDHCQVYRGINSEDPKTTEAVDSTRNYVLLFNGSLIKAFYHSDSGGYTASSKDVWGGKSYSYLKAVKDDFSNNAPHHRWEYRISKKKLIARLKSRGIIHDNFLNIKVVDTDPYGRVKLISINNTVYSANKLRSLLGTTKIYSNMFKIYDKKPGLSAYKNLSLEERINLIISEEEDKNNNDEIVFLGSGSGHGVGLSQWGANGMAKEGYSFRAILEYYYKGTKIGKVNQYTLGNKLVKR